MASWEKVDVCGVVFYGLRRDPKDPDLYLRDAYLPDEYSPFHIQPGMYALSTKHWQDRGFDLPPPIEATVEQPRLVFHG